MRPIRTRAKSRRRAVAILALTMISSAACGSRLNSSVLTQARQSVMGQPSGISGGSQGLQAGSGPVSAANSGNGTPGSGTPLASGPGSSASGDPSSGAATAPDAGGATASAVGGATASNAGGGATTNTGPVASIPASGNGGATDIGVTADSVTLGSATDVSGPVPGLFEGVVVGTKAYFNYINSLGGVYGRQLRLEVADSLTSCSGDENATQSLLNTVFAFVGQLAVYDNCGAQVLRRHTDIPDVSISVSKDAATLPNQFSASPGGLGYQTGAYAYYARKFGAAVQHVGDIYPNIPDTVTVTQYEEAAAKSTGWKFVYTDAVEATDTDFTTDIVRMQAQGVKVVEMELTAQDCATLIQEEVQQNWHPINILYFAYDRQFIQLAGGAQAAEGVVGWTDSPLYFGQQDAAAIPEVARFQTWMARTNPSQTLDTYSWDGWVHAALFVQALRAAGPKPTRAGVMAALKATRNFDDNGLVSPSDPGTKGASTCYVLWQIHNGNFVRADTPATGYNCSGTSFYSYYLAGSTPP